MASERATKSLITETWRKTTRSALRVGRGRTGHSSAWPHHWPGAHLHHHISRGHTSGTPAFLPLFLNELLLHLLPLQLRLDRRGLTSHARPHRPVRPHGTSWAHRPARTHRSSHWSTRSHRTHRTAWAHRSARTHHHHSGVHSRVHHHAVPLHHQSVGAHSSRPPGSHHVRAHGSSTWPHYPVRAWSVTWTHRASWTHGTARPHRASHGPRAHQSSSGSHHGAHGPVRPHWHSVHGSWWSAH
jgi:hypothetical protein